MGKYTLKPSKDVILKLDKPLADTLKVGDLELYLDPTWNPEQHVTVTGTVYALPPKHPYGDTLKPGDNVCFSYQVVADREFDSTPDHFHPYVNEENLKIFYNGHRHRLQIRAVQGLIAKKFVSVLMDENGDFMFGYEGTGNETDRWLSQFKFGDTQQFKFTNCIDLDGEILWKCKFDQIFAKKVGKKLIALSDNIILNPINVNLSKEKLSEMGIVQPKSSLSARVVGEANVEACGTIAGLKKGNKIGFKDQFKLGYTFFGKEYYLLNKNRVEGIWKN